MHKHFFLLLLFLLFASKSLIAGPGNNRDYRKVSKDEFARALIIQKEKGLNLTATTNGSRFQGQALLQLVRWAQENDSIPLPLFIDYQDHYDAYLEVAGISPSEAPDFMRLPYEFRQNILIEYREGMVIKEVKKGPQPQLAISITEWWPETDDLESKFFYIDTLSSPHLRASHQRIITYRILDFGDDMYLYDEINGISGRPLTGLLGLLFKMIGDGKVEQTRIAISDDGLQVLRGKASKGFFSVNQTVTIYKDGRAEKDIPENRPDLLQLEEKLKQDLEIKYYDPILPD